MPITKDNYSLWMVPNGVTGRQLRALINKITKSQNTPSFVPHLTLVANILADQTELIEIKHRIEALAANLRSFKVTLDQYGYLDEDYRCLYLLAYSEQFKFIYSQAAEFFPEVNNQHFKQMPHLSVLYGHFPTSLKDQIINENKLEPLEFMVNALDLFLANDPISSWQKNSGFSLPA